MKKAIFMILSIIAIIGGILVSMFMMSREQKKEAQEQENFTVADKVTDECINEYDELNEDKVKETSIDEAEKLSPNAEIIFEKYYKDCEHTINKREKIPNNLVNFSKEQIEEKYNKWKVKEFSEKKVVLFQEIEGECGEHYMLRDVNGKINIYKLDESGNEELLNETDIATEYLTETDMINMDNGLIVYGRENLNKLLEDFE